MPSKSFSPKLDVFQQLEPLSEKEIRRYMNGASDGTRLPRSYMMKLQSDSIEIIPHIEDFFFASAKLMPFLLRASLQILIDGSGIDAWEQKPEDEKEYFYEALSSILIYEEEIFESLENWSHLYFSKLCDAQLRVVAEVLLETSKQKGHPFRKDARRALAAFWARFL